MQTALAHLGKLTALIMTLAAGLSWWLVPSPQAPRPAQSREQPWTLPVVSQSNPGQSIAAIGAANLWGAAVKIPAQAALIEPEWRFSGVTVNGQERLVVITIQGQPPRTLKAGDELPGGAKILQINNDHLCLLIKNKKRKLDIY